MAMIVLVLSKRAVVDGAIGDLASELLESTTTAVEGLSSFAVVVGATFAEDTAFTSDVLSYLFVLDEGSSVGTAVDVCASKLVNLSALTFEVLRVQSLPELATKVAASAEVVAFGLARSEVLWSVALDVPSIFSGLEECVCLCRKLLIASTLEVGSALFEE